MTPQSRFKIGYYASIIIWLAIVFFLVATLVLSLILSNEVWAKCLGALLAPFALYFIRSLIRNAANTLPRSFSKKE